MKLQLITREETAELVVQAENDFEKAMLDHCETLPQRDIQIATTKEWGTTTKGHIRVIFSTREPAPAEPARTE